MVGKVGGYCLHHYYYSYQQYFDLEGDTGIVVRGIGTCVSLIPKLHTATITPPIRLPPNIQASVAEALLGGVVSPKHIRMGFRKTSSSDSDGPSSPTKGGGEGSGECVHVFVCMYVCVCVCVCLFMCIVIFLSRLKFNHHTSIPYPGQ